MREPDMEHKDTPEASKRTLQGRESMRQATDSRWTVELGMNRTLSKVMLLSWLMFSLIDPILMALMAEPLTPFTVQFEMGQSMTKSLCYGEMCVVQLLPRRKGNAEVDGLAKWKVDMVGEAVIFAELVSCVLEAQSTEATSSS